MNAQGQSVAGIVRRNGRFLLARRKPGGDIGGKWEFPGGKIDPGETPQAALEREFFEEFRVVVRVGPRLATAPFIHRGTRFSVAAYSIELVDDGLYLIEHTEFGWFSAGEVDLLDLPESDRALFQVIRDT